MILTSQMTHDYYLKAQPLLESVKKYWHDRFVLGCIGFNPEGYTGEWFRVEREDIPSYRPDYPKNRPSFVTMQNGDFAKYIDCPDDEVIICVDADTVMQRCLTTLEVNYIYEGMKQHVLLTVYPNEPAQELYIAIANIGGKKYAIHGKEFTTSFLIARKRTFTRLAERYNELFPLLPFITEHHAGNQWLLSLICRDEPVLIMLPKYQCASWYSGFSTTVENGILKVNGETVIFNHTKFNT